MEIESSDRQNNEKKGWRWVKMFPKELIDKICEIGSKTKELAKDDPRRVTHSIKVGIALSGVSIFYYYQPFYQSFGVSAMWAVITVVVVFEYSVGATLGKGVNRGLATLVAGALGVGAHHLAVLSGSTGEPILLAVFVFLQAAVATFIRFFPKVKRKYDYGFMISILTFSLISVSGYRDDEVLDMAHKRLSTIFIGGFACLLVSLLIRPVWAGEDLHNLISLNMEKLGNFLEGFGAAYFNTSSTLHQQYKDDNKFLQGYKSVLNSKATEDSLANFATWEPGHGRFKFSHPWKQYLKIGALTRQCAYRIDGLHAHIINKADSQESPEIRETIKEACTRISLENGKALKELAYSMKTMTQTPYANLHIGSSKMAAKCLRSILKSGLWENIDLLEAIPFVTVASLLLDLVNCTEKVAESVQELASFANFKSATADLNVSPENSQLGKCDSESDSNCDCSGDDSTITDQSPSPTISRRHIGLSVL